MASKKRIMHCTICNKTTTTTHWYKDNIKICKNHTIDPEEGINYIYTTHSAGNRKKQRVKKYKKTCSECGKDCGFVFKPSLNTTCGSCSTKRSYHNKRDINNNFYSLRSKHDTPHQGIVTVRSSYEDFYISFLNDKNIDYLYEPKRFILADGRSYLPDFYLIKDDIYIELKGLLRPEDADKLQQFKKEYKNIKLDVLTLTDIKKIGYAPSKYKNSGKISIFGEGWVYKLADLNDFKNADESCDEETLGLCVSDKKLILISEKDISLDTVIHELKHAYISSIGNESEPLSKEQFEEAVVDLLSKNIFKILAQAIIIQLNLKERLLNRNKIKNPNDDSLDLTLDQSKKLKNAFYGIQKIAQEELISYFKEAMLAINETEE